MADPDVIGTRHGVGDATDIERRTPQPVSVLTDEDICKLPDTSLVEPLAAALAAERRTRADINAMREGLSAMSQHGLHHIAGQAGDRAFHDAILNATGNEYVMVLTSSIGAAVMMTTRFKQRSRALPRDPIPGHRRVFDAIVAEDRSGAAPAMQMLVDQALEDTRQAMDLTTT